MFEKDEKDEERTRSGHPWTDDETTEMVALVRGGADADTIAARVRRGVPSVLSRLRRMLPLEHRSCRRT